MMWGVYFLLALSNSVLKWVNRRLYRNAHPEPADEPKLRRSPRREQEAVLHGRLHNGLVR